MAYTDRKRFIYLLTKSAEDAERNDMLDNLGLDWAYIPRIKGYRIKIDKIEDYRKNKSAFEAIIHDAMEYRNIEI